MNVTQAREAIQDLKAGIIRLAGDAMMEHESEILRVFIDQHEYEGVDSENRPLAPYTRRTVEIKKYKGIYSGHTDFRDTGEFHNTTRLNIDGDEFSFSSPSKTYDGILKSRKLTEWNGSEIMDLTKENEALIYPIIEDTLKDKVNSELALD